MDDSPEVDLERPAPVVELVLPDRALGARPDPGVVAHDVHRAVGRERGIAQRLHGRIHADIGRHAGDVEPIGAQLSHRLVERGLLDVGQHDAHALAGEALRHRPPDTARSASHHGDAPVQPLHG